MPVPQSSSTSVHHLHLVGDTCPTCDQPIPHDRADEIALRLAEQRQAQDAEVTAKLSEKHATEMTEATERLRLEAADQLAAGRLEAKTAAEVAAKAEVDRLAEAGRVAEAALAAKAEEAALAAAAAQAVQEQLSSQLADSLRESAEALEAQRAEAEADIAAAREEAAQEAAAAAAQRVAAAEQAGVALQIKLEEALQSTEAAVAAATAGAASRVTEAEEAQRTAEARASAVAESLETLKAKQGEDLAAALAEQREALEDAKTAAVNAERATAFAENQKLAEKVDGLQRALEKKTAEELGEGAEIDLHETLKAAFQEDRFERVKKGLPGADIIQTVIHNGQECGKIIYDSKNHNAWRGDFVTKLRADQLAAGAEHAVLTVAKFPQGAKQLHFLDGVLIANPARVEAIVDVLRRHLIQTHSLRIGAEQRAEKTAALYDYITSEQFGGILERLADQADKLMKIQDAEKVAHDKVWKQQGETIRATQKVHAELQNQIDSIIGTASAPESSS